ncbi:hypothetical protein BKA70DRAFT_1271752 [Coprinopsis sp. MPI-PUGE-AT-0042]|nr:hypothetical protein BKA70DRAFT_1271752 [Coprinopsis sp. MPI-PUGE-AT-0042]
MARIDGIDLFAVTLRDCGQHDELCTLSENKIVQREQATVELKDRILAYYQYVDKTDGRHLVTCDQFKRMPMERRVRDTQRRYQTPRSSEATVESTLRLLNYPRMKAFKAAASLADTVL